MIETDVMFEKMDVIFGRRPESAFTFLDLDRAVNRAEILQATGQVLGIAGADFSIRQGEICFLVGPAAAGKSTLLRSINGLDKATRGRVLINDDDAPVDIGKCGVDKLRELRRRRLAMIFQDAAFLPWRTVEENIGFGLEIGGMRRKQRALVVAKILEASGLESWADKNFADLQEGMAERVSLARAFAANANIILMDDPFANLSTQTRASLWNELLALQKKFKKTIVITSQDLNEAMTFGDQIVVLDEGKIVQRGTPEAIMLEPANGFVADVVARLSPLDVIPGASCMTPLSALQKGAGTLFLDQNGFVRLTVSNSAKPVSLTVMGREIPITAWKETMGVDQVSAGQLITAPANIPLRTVLELRHRSGQPVILMRDGRMIGVLGDREIYRGLLRHA